LLVLGLAVFEVVLELVYERLQPTAVGLQVVDARLLLLLAQRDVDAAHTAALGGRVE